MTREFEFHRLDLATEARRIASAWLADEDDRRRTRVVTERALPFDVRELLEWREYRAMPDRRCGQIPLTAGERSRLDFTRTNVFHARSAKAIAAELEVSDWQAHYDHQLTVDEHFDVYERAREDVPRSAIPSFMGGVV
jgi:hypothetical protein